MTSCFLRKKEDIYYSEGDSTRFSLQPPCNSSTVTTKDKNQQLTIGKKGFWELSEEGLQQAADHIQVSPFLHS